MLTMRSIKVMNIINRHEMTGKDQNQSEGKVASDLLTYKSPPPIQGAYLREANAYLTTSYYLLAYVTPQQATTHLLN